MIAQLPLKVMQPLSHIAEQPFSAVVQIISSSKILAVICLTGSLAAIPPVRPSVRLSSSSSRLSLFDFSPLPKSWYRRNVMQLPLTQTCALFCSLSTVCRLRCLSSFRASRSAGYDASLRRIDISQRISHWSRSAPSAICHVCVSAGDAAPRIAKRLS